MLLATVTLWALNFTVSKYVLTHGLKPLAFSSTRYFAAAALSRFTCGPNSLRLRQRRLM